MHLSTKCLLCSTTTTLFFEKNGYRIYRCPACGLAVTQLGKNYIEFVEKHYAKGYFTGDPSCGAYVDYKDDKEYIAKNLGKFLKVVSRYKKSGKLLDVGCAMGYFVEQAVARGYDAYGFDPSDYAISQAKTVVESKRLQVGRIDSVKYAPEFFDVITLFDVFEHLDNPLKDLQILKAFLKDDGIIVIATGDMESLAARFLGRRWTFYNPPQHLYFYSHKTLNRVLEKANLVATEWFRIGKWLSLRYVLHLASTISESAIASILLRLTNKLGIGKVPLYIPLQDNMVVVARKK